MILITVPYQRVKSNLFRPGNIKDGDIASIENYSGAKCSEVGSLEKPIKIQKKHTFTYKGKIFVSYCKYSYEILGINGGSFEALRLGIFEADKRSYYKDNNNIYTVDESDRITIIGFPNLEQIIDELRHMFAYGGYFASEAEKNGGYQVFIKDLMNTSKSKNQLKSDEYREYSLNYLMALRLELEFDVKTQNDMKDFILSKEPVSHGPVQLEFKF